MRIVICPTCWTWVVPVLDRCPDCRAALSLYDADPSLAEMDAVMGDRMDRLATVRWERSRLPATGGLWATTTGLLFLPFVSEQANGSLIATPDADHESSSRWSFWPLWRRAAPAGRGLATALAEHEVAAETGSQAERFLSAPGGVFLPREELIQAVVRGRYWTLSRLRGRTLRFQALSHPDDWRPAWRRLLQDDPRWRSIVGNLG